jgi:hypothetical protein
VIIKYYLDLSSSPVSFNQTCILCINKFLIGNVLSIEYILSTLTITRYYRILLGDLILNGIHFFITDYSNIRCYLNQN